MRTNDQENVVLNSIRLGDREKPIWVTHSINTLDDSTKFVNNDKTVFRIDSSANMYDAEGKLFGCFRMDNDHLWYFKYADRSERIETPNKDLIKAEVLVFKTLFERCQVTLEARQ